MGWEDMVIIFIVYECVMYIFIIYTLLQKELEAANCMSSFIHLFLEHAAQLYAFMLVVWGPFSLLKIAEALKELLFMVVLYKYINIYMYIFTTLEIIIEIFKILTHFKIMIINTLHVDIRVFKK